MHFIIKDCEGNAKIITESEVIEITKNSRISNSELKLHPFLKYCMLSP